MLKYATSLKKIDYHIFNIFLQKKQILLTLSCLTFTSTILAIDNNTLPLEPKVIAGRVDIGLQGINHMNLNQHTDKAIIASTTFDIGSNAHVQINQPSVDATLLWRVTGEKMSEIMGNLTANGNLFLVNPNGIVVGSDASIDVGGMIASTLNISNENFQAGHYHFAMPEDKNYGHIHIQPRAKINVRDIGMAAFVAPSIENAGIIQGNIAKVALAAGEAVTVDFYGDKLINLAIVTKPVSATPKNHEGENVKSLINNTGEIKAGKVLFTAEAARDVVDNVINNAGIITVGSIREAGGEVILEAGEQGKTLTTGKIKTNNGNMILRGKSFSFVDNSSNHKVSGHIEAKQIDIFYQGDEDYDYKSNHLSDNIKASKHLALHRTNLDGDIISSTTLAPNTATGNLVTSEKIRLDEIANLNIKLKTAQKKAKLAQTARLNAEKEKAILDAADLVTEEKANMLADSKNTLSYKTQRVSFDKSDLLQIGRKIIIHASEENKLSAEVERLKADIAAVNKSRLTEIVRLDAAREEARAAKNTKLEAIRTTAERQEATRVAAEQARLEAERQEAARIAAEEARLEAERQEAARVAAEQARLEAERQEAIRVAAEQARLEAERQEATRVAAEQARLVLEARLKLAEERAIVAEQEKRELEERLRLAELESLEKSNQLQLLIQKIADSNYEQNENLAKYDSNDTSFWDKFWFFRN